VPVTLEENDGLKTIRLEGAVGIDSAAELKDLLVKALEPGGELRIALGGATDLDVTAMQLLWAARRAAATPDVRFVIEGQVQERVAAALAAAGMERVMAGGEAN
jgi:anti-anti-sigma regulatory factor